MESVGGKTRTGFFNQSLEWSRLRQKPGPDFFSWSPKWSQLDRKSLE